MGKIDEVMGKDDYTFAPYTRQDVLSAFGNQLRKLGYGDTVFVTDVDFDLDGDVLVTFEDTDGDFIDVIFACDLDEMVEEDCYAMVVGDEEDEEQTIIDLDPMQPGVLEGTFAHWIDLTDLSWLSKSVLGALLEVGDVGVKEANKTIEDNKEEILEFRRVKTAKKKRVVRGGKVRKLPVFKTTGRRRLSAKKKAALRKARRKAHTGGAKRKRKRALKIRKTRGL
jgi:hypothetical protein